MSRDASRGLGPRRRRRSRTAKGRSGSTPISGATAPSKRRCCLATSVDVEGASEVPSDEAGFRRYERIEQLPPDLRSTRYYLFPGGCVTYEFAFDGRASASLIFDADSALAFQPRHTLVASVREQSDLKLCGATAPPCPGGS